MEVVSSILLIASLTATQPGGPRTSTTAGWTSTSSKSPEKPTFIKGEIAHAGSTHLVPKRSFLGVRLGFLLQETTLFATVAPKADLEFLEKKLRIGLEIPLNLEMYSVASAANAGETGGGFDHFGRLRKRDYDDARDFVKILRYFTYGKKEDNFYLSLGQIYATTLGHGQAMRRYTANIDVDQTRVGFEIDAYGNYGGFEFALADVTRGNLFGALAFVKPLSAFSDDPMAQSFSVGLAWTTDQRAPWMLARRHPVGTSSVGTVIVDDTNAPEFVTRAVNIFGVDAELKVVKTDSVDLKTYADFSVINGAGNGITLGLLGRFNFRSGSDVHLLRTRLELRSYAANFAPSYFDTIYEFQKLQYIANTDDERPDFPTKLQAILSRQGNRRFGFYLEATYAYPQWLILAVAIEADSEGDDRHLMLHVEVPLRFLDVFATYHQRNFRALFSATKNDMLFAGARLQLLPVLFLNSRVQKSFAWNASDFNGLGGYTSNLSYQIDIEFGFEI